MHFGCGRVLDRGGSGGQVPPQLPDLRLLHPFHLHLLLPALRPEVGDLRLMHRPSRPGLLLPQLQLRPHMRARLHRRGLLHLQRSHRRHLPGLLPLLRLLPQQRSRPLRLQRLHSGDGSGHGNHQLHQMLCRVHHLFGQRPQPVSGLRKPALPDDRGILPGLSHRLPDLHLGLQLPELHPGLLPGGDRLHHSSCFLRESELNRSLQQMLRRVPSQHRNQRLRRRYLLQRRLDLHCLRPGLHSLGWSLLCLFSGVQLRRLQLHQRHHLRQVHHWVLPRHLQRLPELHCQLPGLQLRLLLQPGRLRIFRFSGRGRVLQWSGGTVLLPLRHLRRHLHLLPQLRLRLHSPGLGLHPEPLPGPDPCSGAGSQQFYFPERSHCQPAAVRQHSSRQPDLQPPRRHPSGHFLPAGKLNLLRPLQHPVHGCRVGRIHRQAQRRQ